MGGKHGNPRTCKGLFSRISYRLAQIEETTDTPDEERAFRILQRIIPDLVINGRSLYGEGPLKGAKSIVDVRTTAATQTSAPATPMRRSTHARIK